jgi:geranylgeranyl pyrophosphate synthase
LNDYAEALGLMFQVVDDLLDEESSSEQLGKTAGKDQASAKATFPKLLGAVEAHAYADRLLEHALAALADLADEAELLAWIARYVRGRDH